MEHDSNETKIDMEKFLTQEIFETIFELNKIDMFDHYEICNINNKERMVRYCFKRDLITKGQQNYIEFIFKSIRKASSKKTKVYIVGEEYDDFNNTPCDFSSSYKKLHVDNIVFLLTYKIKDNNDLSIKTDHAIRCSYKRIGRLEFEGLKKQLEKITERITHFLRESRRNY